MLMPSTMPPLHIPDMDGTDMDEDGEDEDDKDMELFYFTTALDARLCSVKKESCCSASQLVT